jgi:TrmH family RNA methyltransferase
VLCRDGIVALVTSHAAYAQGCRGPAPAARARIATDRPVSWPKGRRPSEAALAAGVVLSFFGTDAALSRHGDLARRRPRSVSPVTEDGLAALAETVQPQGWSRCASRSTCRSARPWPRAAAGRGGGGDPRPGQRGHRPAHGRRGRGRRGDLRRRRGRPLQRQMRARVGRQPVPRRRGARPTRSRWSTNCARSACRCWPPPATATTDLDELLDDGSLAAPTAWLFGSEAHGLPPDTPARSTARRPPGAGADLRRRGEPKPGRGRRGVPVCFGAGALHHARTGI